MFGYPRLLALKPASGRRRPVSYWKKFQFPALEFCVCLSGILQLFLCLWDPQFKFFVQFFTNILRSCNVGVGYLKIISVMSVCMPRAKVWTRLGGCEQGGSCCAKYWMLNVKQDRSHRDRAKRSECQGLRSQRDQPFQRSRDQPHWRIALGPWELEGYCQDFTFIEYIQWIRSTFNINRHLVRAPGFDRSWEASWRTDIAK